MRSCADLANSLLAIVIFITVSSASVPDDCSEDELRRCPYPLKVITNSKELSFVTNKQELDLQCEQHLTELQCLDNYTQRCMPDAVRSYFIRLYAGFNDFIHDLCHDGSYQQEFLKHSPCIRQVRSEFDECARNYDLKLRTMEALTNKSHLDEKEINLRICCLFESYVQCYKNVVLNTCGPESAEFTGRSVARIGVSFTEDQCKNNAPTPDICDALSGAWSYIRPDMWMLGCTLLLSFVILPIYR